MSENEERQERADPTTPPSSDAAAWAVLGAVSRQSAEEFIAEQKKVAQKQQMLLDLQAHELKHELSLRHWSLRVHHVSDVMKVSFEIAVALIMIAVALFIGGAVWSAAHDDGLVIQAFSVPPDLAARGMTGEVVAGRMLDRLSDLQAQTESMRNPGSYTNNWGNDIKVQIPDTGVSVGEFNRYLHQWLGHETNITGDVVRTANGLTVTARAGSDAGDSFTGPEADLDSLLRRASEAVYARTQPYRYGTFLYEHDKLLPAMAVFAGDTQSGSAEERAWANVGWANTLGTQNAIQESEDKSRAAVSLNPDIALGWLKLTQNASALGQSEAALAAGRMSLRVIDGRGAENLRPEYLPMFRLEMTGFIDDLLGDYSDEVKQYQAVQAGKAFRFIAEGLSYSIATALVENHDLPAARRFLATLPGFFTDSTIGHSPQIAAVVAQESVHIVELVAALDDRNWPQVLELARDIDAVEPKLTASFNAGVYLPTQNWPYLAYAEAMTGDFESAHAQIDRTPNDCDVCLRFRGRIDAEQKNWSGAAWWFERAVAAAPSSPFAYTDWGAMLLAHGDYDGAIDKFRQANQKGPHFADPLEMWGEALTAKNRSDLALAKFADADKYAPNWGRLHLKWGEALLWSGNKADAEKQFAIAAQLDLSAADKAVLAKVSATP
ncbi:MAG: hypothetical protein ABSC92_04065 [Rhizomicrobium sp.]